MRPSTTTTRPSSDGSANTPAPVPGRSVSLPLWRGYSSATTEREPHAALTTATAWAVVGAATALVSSAADGEGYADTDHGQSAATADRGEPARRPGEPVPG